MIYKDLEDMVLRMISTYDEIEYILKKYNGAENKSYCSHTEFMK